MRGSRGGRPPIATSARWSRTRSRTCSRLPTASVRPIAVVALREGAHERRHEGLGGGRDRGQAQTAIREVGGLARGAPALLEQPDDVGRERRERGAGGGRADAAALALGDRRAQLARQRRDRGRHGWLRDDELVGRGGHRSPAHDGEEATQLRQSYRHEAHLTEIRGEAPRCRASARLVRPLLGCGGCGSLALRAAHPGHAPRVVLDNLPLGELWLVGRRHGAPAAIASRQVSGHRSSFS